MTSSTRTVTSLERLRETIAWARARSRFYAERLRDVDLTVDDEPALLAQVPILERGDVAALPKWPRSPLQCVPPETCVRVHHTSGSSGKSSLWVADTARDWDEIVAAWRVALEHFGVGPADRVLVCAAYGRFIGFWGLHEALVGAGALTVSGADLDTRGRAELIERLGVTVVAATPTYAAVLGDVARRAAHSVRLVLTSGEPRPPASRSRLRRLWGCETRDTAGMTEVGTISAVECVERPGVLHRLERWAYEEVLDPETRRPVAAGASGVRVVTTMRRRSMPFIRYWTGDVVELGPARCDCGLGDAVYERGIEGRVDDVIKVHGVWFLPSMVEEVVRSFPQIDEYRVVRVEDGIGVRDVRLEVERTGPPDERADSEVLDVLAVECKRRLGFRPKLAACPPGTLPRFEAKARRVIRELIGDETAHG